MAPHKAWIDDFPLISVLVGKARAGQRAVSKFY